LIETVGRERFTQAAQALNVTQSTISKMVRQLEEEIGSPLLIRHTRGVQLTDVGRVVYEQGQHALGAMQGLQREVADLTRLHRRELTPGLPPGRRFRRDPAPPAARPLPFHPPARPTVHPPDPPPPAGPA